MSDHSVFIGMPRQKVHANGAVRGLSGSSEGTVQCNNASSIHFTLDDGDYGTIHSGEKKICNNIIYTVEPFRHMFSISLARSRSMILR